MKRLLILFAAAMLFSAPAFAANTTVYTGGQSGGTAGKVENSVSQTNVQGSQLINNGRNNIMEVGGIKNTGGTVKNSVDQTSVKNSTLVNNGEGNELRVGGITNR